MDYIARFLPPPSQYLKGGALSTSIHINVPGKDVAPAREFYPKMGLVHTQLW